MRAASRPGKLGVFVVLFAASAWTLSAQQYYGTLTGTVTDSTGAVVPGAVITVTNLSKGTATSATTNEAGIYRVAALTPGSYRLEAQAPSFKRFTRGPLLVESSRILTADIDLEVGNVAETVSVTSAAPILETESGTVNSTFDGGMINKLPTVGARNDINFYMSKNPYMNNTTLAGAKAAQIVWSEDGAPSTSPLDGRAIRQTTINVETYDSVKLVLVNSGAESSAPAQIQTLTKSGTNDFHGALFWDTHHSVFDAGDHNLPVGAKKSFSRLNDEGLIVSGPVYIPKTYDGRNRTFFLTALDIRRTPLQGAAAYITAPTAAMRTGDFSAYRNPSGALIAIIDPTTGAPFAGNIIPASRLYKGAAPYLDFYLPNPNINTAVFNNNTFGVFDRNAQSLNTLDARLDQTINEKNNFFFRTSKIWTGTGSYLLTIGAGKNTTGTVLDTYLFSDNHAFRPNLLNEFRFAFNNYENPQKVGVTAKTVLDVLGVTGVPEALYANGVTGVPVINITGVRGISQYSDGARIDHTWDIYDNVSWYRLRHSFKFGINMRKDADSQGFWDKPGTFNFTGAFTGTAVADFMLGLPFSAVRSYPRTALGSTDVSAWYAGAYFQDDFKLSPRLTLNFGVRWDISLPGTETHGLYYNFDRATGALVMPSQEVIGKVVPTFPATVKYETAAQAGFPAKLRNTDLNNFVPRLGIAWRPFDDKTVLRAAYGIYTELLGLGYIPTSGPWGGSETFTNSFRSGVPVWQWPSAFPAGVAGTIPGTADITAFDTNLRNPYIQEWNATVERQIERTAFRLQYVGIKSTHLYWYQEQNVPPPSTIPFTVSRRPYPQYGSVLLRTNGLDSNYHALNVSAERRMHQGVTFNSVFTWARMMTNSYEFRGDLSRPAGTTFGYPTFDHGKWKGNEVAMPRFKWNINWYAELPFGHGKVFGNRWHPVLNHVAGGWAISGIFNMQTGGWAAPYYSGGTDPAGIQFNQGPPDRIGNGILNNQGLQPGKYFLDPTAFVMPPNNVGRFGTSGLYFMQEPSWWFLDSGFQKTFPIRERLRFEFLCKVQNLLNHAFWGPGSFSGGLNLSNPATFGTMAGKWQGSRTIGFLGRLAW